MSLPASACSWLKWQSEWDGNVDDLKASNLEVNRRGEIEEAFRTEYTDAGDPPELVPWTSGVIVGIPS